MRKPTVKQFDKVIAKFDDAIKNNRKQLAVDMGNPSVRFSCNTPMCHGGWYVIASAPKGIDERFLNDCLDYDDGADMLAEDLGFEYTTDLTDWASDNSNLWGNSCGDDMFSSPDAFRKDGMINTISLITIRNWWVDVRKRCRPNAPMIRKKKDIV